MLNVNVSNPKAFDAAIRLAAKFADTSRYNHLEATQQIMVQTADKGLRLTATDLNTSIEFAVNSSDVIADGEFCILAKNLVALGSLIKAESSITLEQTEKGVNLSLHDSPTFGATFEVKATDEFPMLPETDPKAHWIELNAEHITMVKAISKYAVIGRYRHGFDAVQFARQGESLYVYATDGTTVAFAKLGRTSELPNFAIPVEAVKKALQIANTPDLKKSRWRITLPTEDREVVTLQIQETAVKVRAGDALDLTEWIQRRVTHYTEADNYLAFDPKALTSGLKKVSKLFMKDKKFTDVLIIESDADGKVTMTTKPKKAGYGTPTGQEQQAMQSEYVHEFSPSEVRCTTGVRPFRIRVDARKFQEMVKALVVSKPKYISVMAKYGVLDVDGEPAHDAVLVSGTELPLSFVTMPVEL